MIEKKKRRRAEEQIWNTEGRVGEVELEANRVNEKFNSGGPRRIAEIAEVGMINI